MSIKSLFENIADAIRETSGSSDTYTPAEMPDAIRNFNSIFQTKILSSPIDGQTTVESCLNALSEKTDLTYNTVSGNPVSFTTDSSGISRNTIVTLEPIQSGSGDPSPTNVRPISGYTEIDVNGCGVNVWDEEWTVGILIDDGVLNINSTTRRTTSFIPVMPNTEYYATNDYVLNGRVAYYDENKNCVYYSSAGLQSRNITTPNDAHYLRITLDSSYGTTYNHDISINYPSTDTSYHAYTGHRITSPLPSTIYGGTYDVETGVLTVNYALVDLGTLTWTKPSSGCFVSNVLSPSGSASTFGGENPIVCSVYPKNETRMSVADYDDKHCGLSVNGTQLCIKDTDYTDAATFKTAMSGVQLAYELATPYTIQLEPHLLPLLSGANTVSTNGTSISVTYRKGLIARVDDLSAVADAINTIVTILENSN